MSIQEVSYVDRFQTTLASSYTAGGGSLSLTSGTGLPSGACYFFLTVRAEGSNTEEVFLCTNRSGTTLTVTGAQANTSSSNHGASAVVVASIMAAAAFNKLALMQLDQQVLGSPAASFTFSSIPATFTDIVLCVMGRSANASLQDDVYMELNSDTGSNYSREYIGANVGTITNGNQHLTTHVVIGTISGATATANYPGAFEAVLFNYANTTFYKVAKSLGGWYNGSAGASEWVISIAWEWASTAAVTSIKLALTSAANFATGTTVTVYGRR